MNSLDTSRVSMVEVPAEYAGQRIDNFLLRLLKGVPKSMVYRILRKGEVRVNKGRIKPDYRVQAGDMIRLPPLRMSDPEQPPALSSGLAQRLREAVLYEDGQFLVLNKPSGLAVHSGSGVEFGVIEALRALQSEPTFLELVHRLDRETSGCLLLAKSVDALRQAQTALQSSDSDKRYLALLRGPWQHGTCHIQAPLRKNTLRGGERMVEVAEDGKPADSAFRPLSVNKTASLMEVQLLTGRTHQIRVHAHYAGHPVAGDEKYGDAEFNRQLGREYGLRRLFLHAHSLTLDLAGRTLAVSAPLPDDLAQPLEHLGLNH